jgi:cell division protein FtsI/penicillin-binding protein 2
MLAALSSVVNGGTYYRPHLVDTKVLASGEEVQTQPEIVRSNAVSSDVSNNLVSMMEYVVSKNNRSAARDGYRVGGKTGTAQIPNPAGGYFEDRFNGTYLGFVGGETIEYTIIVRVDEPKIKGYAGAKAAAPIFASLSNMLLNNFNINPTQ